MNKVYYPLNEEAHRTAHNANSFMDYKSDNPEYKAKVDDVYRLADEAAERCPERADEAYSLADRYAKKYAEWLNKSYRIDAMCPSVMVAGPSNFPTRKKEKQNAARERHYEEHKKLDHYRNKIRKIGTSSECIKSSDDNAVEKLQTKIDAMRSKQEAMKKANAEARKNGKEAPFKPYQLSNNNQKIHATERRLKDLQAKKEQGTMQSTVQIMGETATVVENTELMRLQLLFDGKPSEEVRTLLKKHGFKWSPKNLAWQRQLTTNARFALRNIAKAS